MKIQSGETDRQQDLYSQTDELKKKCRSRAQVKLVLTHREQRVKIAESILLKAAPAAKT